MGILNPISRIIDVTLTDKARAKVAFGEKIRITKFALFDYGIDYKKVDFTEKPDDPDYATPFTIEPIKRENLLQYSNRLFSIPPGTDSRRMLTVSPDEAMFSEKNSVVCEVKTRVMLKATGEPIFSKNTQYVVFLKNPEDFKYVELLEIVEPDEDFITPPDTPETIDPNDGFNVGN